MKTDRSLQAWVQAGQKRRLPIGGGEDRAEHLGRRVNNQLALPNTFTVTVLLYPHQPWVVRDNYTSSTDKGPKTRQDHRATHSQALHVRPVCGT